VDADSFAMFEVSKGVARQEYQAERHTKEKSRQSGKDIATACRQVSAAVAAMR
jgi:hypothetical protein